jgi:hypothetical protein
MNEMVEGFQADMTRKLQTIGKRFGLSNLLALGVLLSASAANANNVYVAQNSAGGGNGASCAAARSINSLGSGDWTAGNTIHLCGTFTSSLTAQGNGTSGAPITVLFEPGANFTAPAISNGGAIVLANQSFIIVDGGSTVPCGFVNGSNVTCNNGKIQSTANGTGLANQVASIGVEADSANNIEIRNLEIGPLYLHTSTSDHTQSPPGPLCVQFNGANNVSIHNNTMHDAGWCLNGGGGPSTNLNMFNNEIYNVDHGVGIGNSNTNINIYGNHFHDFTTWDTTDNSFHHDGIHLFGVTGAVINGANIYNNLFDGDIGFNETAWFFGEGQIQNIKFYNNVGYMAPGRQSGNGVFDYNGNGFTGSNNSFYNNTVLGAFVGGSGTCMMAQANTNFTMKNNVLIGCQNMTGVSSDTSLAPGGVNNNVYEDIDTDHNLGGSGNTFAWGNSQFSSFTQWKSSCGCDANSFFGTLSKININATTGMPNAGSAVIGVGANLTALGITTLDTDKGGNPRPSGSSAWDAGAYQFAVLSQPAPPTNVKAVAQ